jgi:hypothetical protein
MPLVVAPVKEAVEGFEVSEDDRADAQESALGLAKLHCLKGLPN